VAVFAGEEGTLDVDAVGAVERLLVVVIQFADRTRIAGIAEQHVDLAPAGGGGIDIGLHGRGLGHVARKDLDIRAAKFLLRCRQAGGVEIHEQHRGAVLQEQPRGGQPDAAAAARDDAHLVFQQ
jgi:hypothetical protein